MKPLTTARLHLRKMTLCDDAEILFLRSDERILKYLDIPVARSIEDARKFIEKIITNDECYYWGITLKGSDKLIGTICIWNISEDKRRADIGYVLHPDYQRKGLMQEAVEAILDFGFDTLKLTAIDADVDPKNDPSIRLLVKNGFKLSKSMENTVIYSLNKINQ